eukprot:2016389-Alexandrium_andersonii.AAC.1
MFEPLAVSQRQLLIGNSVHVPSFCMFIALALSHTVRKPADAPEALLLGAPSEDFISSDSDDV